MDIKDKRKGKKGARGVPIYYQEVKKRRTILLTDSIMNAIDTTRESLSRSEFIEQLLRKHLEIPS